MPDPAADPANPRVLFAPTSLPPTLPPNPSNVASHEAPDSPAPASAHDAVVARLLASRPPLPPRAASAPSVPSEARSIAELMAAETLEPSGARVSRALNDHIAAVLAAQDEIGRAHLALEGIGDPFEDRGASARQLHAREAGVDAIMARLAELAGDLRSYHTLGTPVFAFAPAAPRVPTLQDGGATTPIAAAPRTPVVTIAHRGNAEPAEPSPLSALRRPALWLHRLDDGAHHAHHASPTEMSAKSPLSAETPAMSPF
ncbi:hypothetical protein Q8F55_002133 [Vanrija albida]|uniref:Mediator complex subunit 11 n=1 Tax=Vanrija albida TaxID=181172 RepID=A0ABR3Q9J3_9TREE